MTEANKYSAIERVSRYVFSGVKKATVYVSPKFVAKATRQGRSDKRNNQMTMIVTAGRPNYRERIFIKACLKAGEAFPVKKAQLRL